jgi:hypothetical protein
VDQARAADVIKTESLQTTPHFFPFTEEAAEALATHISNNQERALPAAIISVMSNAAIEAWRSRQTSSVRQLVTHDIIESTIFPEG